MLITWLIFLGLTIVLVAVHVRRTRDSFTPRCARCGKEVLAGAQRCNGCGAPLQIFEVVSAATAEGEEPDAGSLHAVVRADMCVGCGACVPACPVENAIRMQGKLAVVVVDLCEGHGKCAEACPVGAIHVGAGSARRVEVPLVDANFESNVRGLYVVGELGGRGLIKNAINEGKIAAERIAALEPECAGTTRGPHVHAVAIVGAGPSGLSAALECHRRGIDYLLLEQGSSAESIRRYPRHKLLLAEPLHVPLYGDLWIADADKESLLRAWETIIQTTGLRVHGDHRVESIVHVPAEDRFELHTTGGEYHARRVILAMGRRGTPRRLGVPGEELGKVFYDVVEMEEFAGSRVVVVGGGDSALESALGMAAQPGTEVVLSHRGADFARAKQRNVDKLAVAEREGRIAVWLESHVRAVREHEIDIERGGALQTLANDYLVIRIGGEAPHDFLRRVGIDIVKKDIPLVGSGAGA